MVKTLLAAPLRMLLRLSEPARERLRRLGAHAALGARLRYPLPASVVVLGRAQVYGTGAIRFSEHALVYPDLHLETHDGAEVRLGKGVVLSRGVHLVAMAGVTIGDGTMIGEYTSVRDGNHDRAPNIAIREAGHSARAIHIGAEVWIGRGAAILAGVTIGDGATVAANAVVTRDVAAGATVGGVPARALVRRTEHPA